MRLPEDFGYATFLQTRLQALQVTTNLHQFLLNERPFIPFLLQLYLPRKFALLKLHIRFTGIGCPRVSYRNQSSGNTPTSR